MMYRVIREPHIEQLARKVNLGMLRNWKPVGGVAIVYEGEYTEDDKTLPITSYLQAMVRDDDNTYEEAVSIRDVPRPSERGTDGRAHR